MFMANVNCYRKSTIATKADGHPLYAFILFTEVDNTLAME